MHRIDGAGHVDHLFVAEDPATLRPPTEITPEIMNAFQEELATFIEWAGIVLAKGDNTQLKQALLAKFAKLDSPTFSGTPLAPTAAIGTNNNQIANTAFVQAAISALVAAAPGALDTLKELADALGGDPNFAATVTNALAAKITQAQGDARYVLQSSQLPEIPVRQTVMGGPVDASGLPSFLPSTSANLSITSQNISAVAKFVVAAANGFNSTGALDRVGISTANLTWSNLTASATNYLYVDIASDGALTPGSTTLAPIYQFGGNRSTTSGQATYNIQEASMTVGNGSSAVQAYRVFVGEAVTNAGTVTSTVAYAYQGKYYSSVFSIAASTNYNKSANIGTDPKLFDAQMKIANTNNIWTPWTANILESGSGTGNRGVDIKCVDRNSVRVTTTTDLNISPDSDFNGPTQAVINVSRGW